MAIHAKSVYNEIIRLCSAVIICSDQRVYETICFIGLRVRIVRQTNLILSQEPELRSYAIAYPEILRLLALRDVIHTLKMARLEAACISFLHAYQIAPAIHFRYLQCMHCGSKHTSYIPRI